MANGHGGYRPGSGGKAQPRAPHVEAAFTDDLRSCEDAEALARRFTAVAIEVLVSVACKGFSEPARVQAAKALLERGHGQPAAAAAEEPATSPSPDAAAWSGLLS